MPQGIADHHDLLFTSDNPITEPNADRLGRAELAQKLARFLSANNPEDCLVLGIHGLWGSGKSSFLNLLGHEVESLGEVDEKGRSKNLVIRFNPWNYCSIDQLIELFFAELARVLKHHSDSQVAKRIGGILKALGGILAPAKIAPLGIGEGIEAVSALLKGAGSALDNLAEEEPLFALKNALEQELVSSGLRLFVFVDDIDRLEAEMVGLLFRLIRLNADFKNTTYVLAFDRTVIESALEKVSGTSGREYLKKIIQVPFDLPMPESETLEQLFFEGLDKQCPIHELSQQEGIRLQQIYRRGISHFMRTVRDVKSFLNGFASSFGALSANLNLVDFVGLESVRIFMPDIYEEIRRRRGVVLLHPDSPQANEQAKQVGHELWDRMMSLAEGRTGAAKSILEELFPQMQWYVDQVEFPQDWQVLWSREKRICSEHFFEHFFLLGTPRNRISDREIQSTLSLLPDEGAFQKAIIDMCQTFPVADTLFMLSDQIEQAPIEIKASAMAPLLNLADSLPEMSSNEATIVQRLAYVVLGILKSVEEGDRRDDLFLNALIHTESLQAGTLLVSLILSMDMNVVVSSEALHEAEELVRERILREAEAEELHRRVGFATILMCWREQLDQDETDGYVSGLLKSHEMIAALIEDIAKRQPQDDAELDVYLLKRIVDLKTLERSIQDILTEPNDAISKDVRANLSAVLERIAAIKQEEKQ